jgi:hypothetical protein
MGKKDSCPLDGSWTRDHCKAYNDRKKNQTLSECPHRDKCANVRKIIETDLDESVASSKEILLDGIPSIFES